jgi:transposase
MQVSVVNPMQIKHFARSKLSRGKTDALDAKLIAEFTARMQPVLWHPQTQTFEEIKSLSRALDNLKGIGVVTASLLLAETRGCLKQFSARGASAFAGLNPCPRESAIPPEGASWNQEGLMKGKAVLSGLGNPGLRRGFYMAALSASRGKNRFAELNKRLREAGKPGKVALIAVAHKILSVAVAVVRSGVPFNPRFLEQRVEGLTG